MSSRRSNASSTCPGLPDAVGLALLVMFVLAACTAPVEAPPQNTATQPEAPPVPRAPVTTDRSAYTFGEGPQGPELTIVATLRAPADRAVYIVNCNGASSVTLQRKSGEQWVFAWSPTMNACLSAPIVVPPDGEQTAKVYLHENSGAVIDPQGARLIGSGTYRVVWTGVLTSFDANVRGFGPDLPLEERVSAPITIHVAGR